MSSGEPRPQADSATWTSAVFDFFGRHSGAIILVVPGAGLILAIFITLSGFGGSVNNGPAKVQDADPLEEARETLEHDADVGACRQALQQINVALASRPDDQRSAAQDPKVLERLQRDLDLNPEDMSEVGPDNYTLLDGWHLAGAFLFRDAATHALEPQELGIDLPPQARPTPLDRAAAAFAWTVREVRLAPPPDVGVAPPTDIGQTPPQFVVRRASGTPLERALVFLDLIDQLSATGPKPLKLTKVDAAAKKVTLKDDAGKEWPVAVGDARIRVDGAGDKKIDDLKEGMAVAVQAQGDRTTAIDAWTTAPPPALLGCLVFCEGHPAQRDDHRPGDPWACGVMVYGRPEIYLFDPRLGLPLPGEGGVGVADLADVARKPELLRQLKIEGAPEYDVTPEQAAKAELHVVCSLSALAPRMEHLQEKVLPPIRVSLYHNLDREMQLWRDAAAKSEGPHPDVELWKEGPTLLRRFLSPDEGGSDRGWPSPGYPLAALTGFTHPNDPTNVQMQRFRLFQLELAPWDVMPEVFQDLGKFPYNVGLGQRVRENYMAPFLRLALEPQGPRDRLLRGDFDKAAEDLVSFSARMEQQQKRRAEEGSEKELEDKVNKWAESAVAAYADQIRAQTNGTPEDREKADKAVDEVWKDSGSVRILLEGASSVPGRAEVTYQLGLCKHEKAEQAQARLELLRREQGSKVPALEIEDVKTAWMDALGWWKKYGDDHPQEVKDRPSTKPGRAAAVRRMQARAQEMLGDVETHPDGKAAAATLEDAKEPPLFPLERLADQYRAQQLNQKHP